jgi:hypothetical protein
MTSIVPSRGGQSSLTWFRQGRILLARPSLTSCVNTLRDLESLAPAANRDYSAPWTFVARTGTSDGRPHPARFRHHDLGRKVIDVDDRPGLALKWTNACFENSRSRRLTGVIQAAWTKFPFGSAFMKTASSPANGGGFTPAPTLGGSVIGTRSLAKHGATVRCGGDAAVDEEFDALDERSIFRSQEEHRFSNIVGLAPAAERDAGSGALFQFSEFFGRPLSSPAVEESDFVPNVTVKMSQRSRRTG